MSQQPTIGRIVHYSLSEKDAESVNRRRADTASHIEKHRERANGVQVHVGYGVEAGLTRAAMVVGVVAAGEIDLQVFLNGTDTLWVTNAREGAEPGSWAWPPRT